jgi:LmbE family N-acetylglucosaminyl deacetylase
VNSGKRWLNLKKSIVGFAAHPDDLEFTSTGTLSKMKKSGYEINYVIVTNGENGFKKESKWEPKERIEIRLREQLEVARKLGVNEVVFLDYSDGFLTYSDELRSQLVGIIKKYQPQIIFSFDPANREFDNLNLFHRDHRVLSEVVFDACFAAKNKHMYPGKPHQIEKIYFYGTNQPNHFEDITKSIDFKLELLACHQSQFPDFKKVADFVKNKLSKGTKKYKYSEAFRVMEVEQLT